MAEKSAARTTPPPGIGASAESARVIPKKWKSPTRPKASTLTKIPAEQMDMPVSFDPAGNVVTLRELMKPGHGVFATLASLSPEMRAELTVKRLEAKPNFEMAMIGGGLIDRERAIQEVRAHSDIGRVLTEIEQLVVQNLLEEVAAR